MVNRVPESFREVFGRSYNKDLTFNWEFHNGKKIRTHLTTNHYSSPPGTDCPDNCTKEKNFHKNDTYWFFARTKMQYSYDPWYFMGDDFKYKEAQINFKFLSEILPELENAKLSLFTDYLNRIESYPKKDLKSFKDDLFVYEESNGDSWSGYYTTKPRLKRNIRQVGNILRNFKLIVAYLISEYKKEIDQLIDVMEDVAVFMHHDSITGTAKRAVDDDYFERIKKIEAYIMQFFSSKLKRNVHLINRFDELTIFSQ